MSYILDALKKAESERKSGSAPALHATQQIFVVPSDDEPSVRTRPWMALGLAASAAILLTLGWLKFWRAEPPAVAPPALAQAPAPVQQIPATVQQEAPAAPPQAPSAPVASRAADAPEQPVPPAKPAKQQARPAKESTEKKPAKASAHAKPQLGETAAPSDDNRVVVALRELPPHIQNQLPALKVSGYIYSKNKADRTVLINNRLLREGDQVAPDLTLESLTSSGMVLNYKGYRYRSSY